MKHFFVLFCHLSLNGESLNNVFATIFHVFKVNRDPTVMFYRKNNVIQVWNDIKVRNFGELFLLGTKVEACTTSHEYGCSSRLHF